MKSEEKIKNLTNKVAILIKEVNTLSNTIEELLKENEFLNQKCFYSNNFSNEINFQREIENENISLKIERDNLNSILFENSIDNKIITYQDMENQLKLMKNELQLLKHLENLAIINNVIPNESKENNFKNEDLELKLKNSEIALQLEKELRNKEKKEFMEKIGNFSRLDSKKEESLEKIEVSVIDSNNKNGILDNSVGSGRKKSGIEKKNKNSDKKIEGKIERKIDKKEKKSLNDKKSQNDENTNSSNGKKFNNRKQSIKINTIKIMIKK